MGAPVQIEDAKKQWTSLITVAFRRRIRADQLTDAFAELWHKAHLPGAVIVSLILTSGARLSSGVDPLVPAYLDEVLKVTGVEICDVLIALLAQTRYASNNSVDQNDPSAYDLLLIESVFALLLRLTVNGKQPRTAQESRRGARALAEWLTACNYHETLLQVQSEGLRAPDLSVVSALEIIATFAMSLFANQIARNDMSNPRFRDINEKMAFALNNFAALLSQWSSSQIPARLQMIARTPPFANGTPDFSMSEIATAVEDLPVSISRTDIYIYLNAALCARPLTDDLTFLSYMHSKYQSDTQSLMMDLIVSSFDAFANALHRNEPVQVLLCYRSFIANKLPLLLTSLSASLFPASGSQICIQTAMGRIDVHPYPPLSSENDGINEALRGSRQEFLHACVMHQLGTDSLFSSITGEPGSAHNARSVKYTKEGLAAQCVSNVHRVDQLVRELDAMGGNAGAISGALIETVQHLCNMKETMSLRTVCNAITRRLSLLDVIFQYAQPLDILQPLCRTLHEWSHDEDQSEFQPPYEEFASILLLVLATIHRYQLSGPDLGLTRDNFVIQLLAQMSDSIPTSKMTQEQNKHLSKWMQGLYATDEHGETNGISDETMSHCPPQAFYLLVPTLLEQSIQGCRAGYLALNTLKGGLEFLLEPFLLPALIGGLRWLTKHSWEDHGDADVLIDVLHKLLRPTSISGDAQAMHQTIIAMVAAPLERSLRELDRRVPNRKEIALLIEALKAHSHSQRSTGGSIAEITQWTSTPGGGLRQSIKDVIGNLVRWSSQSSISPVPPSYTHRMILVAIESLGADEVLEVIIEEVKAQTQIGFGSAALEVATALVCAPSHDQGNTMLPFEDNTALTSHHRRTLRQALRHKLEAPKELLSMQTEYVETLIRLGRRVDAQSAVAPINQIAMPMANLDSQDLMQDMDMNGADMTADGMNMQQQQQAQPTESMHQDNDPSAFANLGGSLDLSRAAAAGLGGVDINDHHNAVPVDLSAHLFDPGQDLDFDMTGAAGSQNNNAQNGNNNSAQNAEDDIFAGLDMGDMGDMGDDDFNFS
ncbi:hypothetical protein AAFC00_003560 [Neodothiora populina]|uniref:Mediator of RNA polymerase II transcription subunit 5 n=1 Tax=Neodothiora populina TaxID=2781224 RepID=A0ABR3PEM8_9PEZI